MTDPVIRLNVALKCPSGRMAPAGLPAASRRIFAHEGRTASRTSVTMVVMISNQ